MEQKIVVLHNKHKGGDNGCDMEKISHYRTRECLENFASSIGVDLKTAIDMGFIKDMTVDEMKRLGIECDI